MTSESTNKTNVRNRPLVSTAKLTLTDQQWSPDELPADGVFLIVQRSSDVRARWARCVCIGEGRSDDMARCQYGAASPTRVKVTQNIRPRSDSLANTRDICEKCTNGPLKLLYI